MTDCSFDDLGSFQQERRPCLLVDVQSALLLHFDDLPLSSDPGTLALNFVVVSHGRGRGRGRRCILLHHVVEVNSQKCGRSKQKSQSADFSGQRFVNGMVWVAVVGESLTPTSVGLVPIDQTVKAKQESNRNAENDGKPLVNLREPFPSFGGSHVAQKQM